MDKNTVNGALPLMNNTQSALNIQTTTNAINFNNISSYIGTVNALNNVISSMYGVTVKWFRAAPVDRSIDVIFHEYTLMNVTDCGFDINVIYDDTGYDEAALQYNMMGIQYQIPLTLNISVDVWNTATNNDGTLPQKKDIVYFPQSNKLYQVVSMNPVKTVASQITSYKCNLAIYKPERSVNLNNDLADTINNYTESINSVFGEDIKNEIEDITSDRQTSPFNSSNTMDKYKKLGFDKNDNRIIYDKLICDGHLISRNYYNNDNKLSYIVKYMHSNDDIQSSNRFYSIIFRLKNNSSNYNTLTEVKTNKTSKIYKSDKKILPKFLTINKGLINLFGINDNDKIKIDNLELENYPDNWYKLGSYTINNNQYNLLTGLNNESEKISIDVITNILVLTINSKVYNIPLDINLMNNVWYNLSINLSQNGNLRIYKLDSTIEEICYKEFNIKNWKNINISTYKILGADIDIRNIRLFNEEIIDKDKQLINIISEFSDDSSKLIIVDNVDEYEYNSYYGSQR